MKRLIGERLVVGFYGTSAPSSLLSMVHRGEIAGVIIFTRNIASRSALHSLIARVQKARPRHDPPLIVATDQEGGLVKRLDGPPTMSPAQIGREDNVSVARSQGRATAHNLRRAGINVDLAPVLDVARPGTIMAQTQRSYGSDPHLVARMGVAFTQGLAADHVAATAKHFPGLGAATTNEDNQINDITLSRSTLRGVDELPFGAAARAHIPLIMISTALYPALAKRPAIFAPNVAGRELREHLGFKGISITDDLDTPAAQRFGPAGARALESVKAGANLLLFAQYPGDIARARGRLVHAALTGGISVATLRTTAARIRALRTRLP